MDDFGLLPEAMYSSENRKSEFYKKIFDDFPALIWIAGTDAKCWYFNKNWLNFRGRTLNQEFGNGWAEGVHKDDFDRCLEIYLTNFNRRTSFSMEYRLMNYQGEYKWILDMGIPFYGPEGEFAGFIGSCYDVTEEKEMVEELKKSKEAALQALVAKTNLIAYVVHELRTPIGNIISFISLLSERKFDDETSKIIEYISSSSKMLLGLTNNLLDLAKFESGNAEFEKEPFGIDNIKTEISQIFRARIEDRGIKFLLNVSPEIPKILYGDEMRIMQIISNLLSNSLKFTDRGEIELSFGYKDEKLIIQVRDTGIGINEEKKKHLWEQYIQGGAAISRKYGGTGLGLSIVKTLTDIMGGEIYVESETGKGTLFRISLNTAI